MTSKEDQIGITREGQLQCFRAVPRFEYTTAQVRHNVDQRLSDTPVIFRD